MQKGYLFCDGNYLFHLTKALGKTQAFDVLEKNMLDTLDLAGFEAKFFYTRPPETTNPKSVIGWLKAHQWNVHTFTYQHTHQDSMYVNLVADLWKCYTASPTGKFAIVSGSGALSYPLKDFPGDVKVFATTDSLNKRLAEQLAPNECFNLEDVL